ncbi:MAG: PHP domain-containing protein, partial [Acidimicrobiia bacterium]|nr:PHP domain-containing protein [Acidimicrobiia bacterium]
MVTNRDIIRMLHELADLTTLEEESPQSFKVRAYENAIGGIEGVSGALAEMSQTELTKIKGVGKSTAAKIRELVETSKVDKLERLRAAYPPSIVSLSKIPGVGPKTLKLMRSDLGIETVEDLQEAIASEQLRELPGLGPTSEEKIGRAIERLGLHGKDRRTPIGDAMGLARELADNLRSLPGVVAAQHCGSLRRYSETIGDIDIVVASDDPQPVMDYVANHDIVVEIVGSGSTKTSILNRDGLQVDVRVVTPDQFGAATLYFTGSKSHNIALRQRAIDRDLLLNEYGLMDEGKKTVASTTEEEVYEALELVYIPPPLREGTGEIEAASEDALPDLVNLEHIRGDLHYHTTQSGDGRSSLEDMVDAAISRGYAYVAITDHGEDLAINGSTSEEMLEHRERIAGVEADRDSIRLFWGCELNIGADGSLDYDSDFRATFDWTVASVHSHFDLDQADQTERLLTAISDPSVDVIGHLSGRYIGRRPGIEFDVDAVIDALADTDT